MAIEISLSLSLSLVYFRDLELNNRLCESRQVPCDNLGTGQKVWGGGGWSGAEHLEMWLI